MTELVGIAAIAVVAWFAVGTIWNVRKGSALLRWLQGGLGVLGERTTVRWLGSSVVEMVLRETKAPFSAVTLVIFLEPRDLPWWPLSHLRGRRDTLIIRGVFRSAPQFEFEALDPVSWSGRDALPRIPNEWNQRSAVGPGGFDVHHSGASALERADELLALTKRGRLRLRRMALRCTEPNFQIHVALPEGGQTACDFFETVLALAEVALG